MITLELVSFIRKQIESNIPKDIIISKLIGVGWHREDINEGFLSIESEIKPSVSIPEIKVEKIELPQEIENINHEVSKDKIIDKYHEPIEGDNLFEPEQVQYKIETPVETPIIETKVEAPTIIPIIETPKIEVPKNEAPKVWTPMNIPVKEKTLEDKSEPYVEAKTTQIEIQNKELQPKKEEQPSQPKVAINFYPFIKTKSVDRTEKFLPTLVSKSVVNSFGSINKNSSIKPDTAQTEPPKKPINNNLAKMAMLSSYTKDLQSASLAQLENIKNTKHKKTKWIVISAVVLVVGLITFAIVGGYINLSKINFSFIKKDPKTLLLNNSNVLSSLKSYKTETNLDISSPSFSNITYGLLSGEAVQSQDKDTFSINTLGIINQDEKGLSSDNFVTIKSSLLPDPITTDIKNDSTDLYIVVPDLSEILKNDTPKATVVKINEQQFGMIPPLFSTKIQTALNKINIYKILSSGMPSYINSDTLGAYNDLINNVDIVSKGEENIKGIDTYHYGINADRQLAKNLLNKISDNFVSNLSDEDKNGLTNILGSVTISSFDVWIGKGDNNIYQYNVVLDVPLSKIIGFEDKSIGDNTVSINWKTTYYDFNISNNILIPEESVAVTDFVNNINETKMRNNISSFRQLASNLSKAEGSYGKKSNPSGSCINPTPGSLFSPTGHTKNATDAVSSISKLLNNILGITNNAGFCYSTTKAWSFVIPISSSYDVSSLPPEGYTSFFCIDSTGTTQDLTASPNGVVCK